MEEFLSMGLDNVKQAKPFDGYPALTIYGTGTDGEDPVSYEIYAVLMSKRACNNLIKLAEQAIEALEQKMMEDDDE